GPWRRAVARRWTWWISTARGVARQSDVISIALASKTPRRWARDGDDDEGTQGLGRVGPGRVVLPRRAVPPDEPRRGVARRAGAVRAFSRHDRDPLPGPIGPLPDVDDPGGARGRQGRAAAGAGPRAGAHGGRRDGVR